ncbi:hypothetical protein BMETH_897_1 [methanotrophic bacterial endosymbiont of Bathymodiolus sp.]|nr:hypothetical protein BMETH_897_1 [methanotrophic bacterial endosymbiont of Bathymodiolus sp.]
MNEVGSPTEDFRSCWAYTKTCTQTNQSYAASLCSFDSLVMLALGE